LPKTIKRHVLTSKQQKLSAKPLPRLCQRLLIRVLPWLAELNECSAFSNQTATVTKHYTDENGRR